MSWIMTLGFRECQLETQTLPMVWKQASILGLMLKALPIKPANLAHFISGLCMLLHASASQTLPELSYYFPLLKTLSTRASFCPIFAETSIIL